MYQDRFPTGIPELDTIIKEGAPRGALTERYSFLHRKGNAGIKCHTCGLTSWNFNDVRERYCGKCHVFHDDPRGGS